MPLCSFSSIEGAKSGRADKKKQMNLESALLLVLTSQLHTTGDQGPAGVGNRGGLEADPNETRRALSKPLGEGPPAMVTSRRAARTLGGWSRCRRDGVNDAPACAANAGAAFGIVDGGVVMWNETSVSAAGARYGEESRESVGNRSVQSGKEEPGFEAEKRFAIRRIFHHYENTPAISCQAIFLTAAPSRSAPRLPLEPDRPLRSRKPGMER